MARRDLLRNNLQGTNNKHRATLSVKLGEAAITGTYVGSGDGRWAVGALIAVGAIVAAIAIIVAVAHRI
jgi:hypothetical protein